MSYNWEYKLKAIKYAKWFGYKSKTPYNYKTKIISLKISLMVDYLLIDQTFFGLLMVIKHIKSDRRGRLDIIAIIDKFDKSILNYAFTDGSIHKYIFRELIFETMNKHARPLIIH